MLSLPSSLEAFTLPVRVVLALMAATSWSTVCTAPSPVSAVPGVRPASAEHGIGTAPPTVIEFVPSASPARSMLLPVPPTVTPVTLCAVSCAVDVGPRRGRIAGDRRRQRDVRGGGAVADGDHAVDCGRTVSVWPVVVGLLTPRSAVEARLGRCRRWRRCPPWCRCAGGVRSEGQFGAGEVLADGHRNALRDRDRPGSR